ncbi:zinc dependent phospholipase C family protein [Hyalangium gracile]|uniref:zinc dependent phospholipase C family protein n=1 Tax=Hyalangium gracile TaxID=394092 RepID=UPI001CCACA99|nr:zinc dependent phospholipase C family protein [Hyalangium gracile]
MPTLLLHLTAIEQLAAHPGNLPPDIARALAEDLPYARFGAALPDLPVCEGLRGGLSALLPEKDLPPFARLYHERAPVGLGLKMGELVATGALVGTEPGLAVLAGYFTHLCLDRRLHPEVDRLVARHKRKEESVLDAHRQLEWAQTLFYLRELHGMEILGTPRLRERFQVIKSASFPYRGIGRGIYELVRLSSQERVGQAPTKAQVDGWVRGLYLMGMVLSSPLGRTRALPAYSQLSFHELYRHDGFDFAAEVDAALEQTRSILRRLLAYMTRGTFTPRTRARFLEEFPEGTIGAYAA